MLLDTTLHCCCSSPCYDMTRDQKVRLALSLERLGVDIIETGFPALYPAQFDDVRAITESLGSAAVSVMTGVDLQEIKRAGEAVRGAKTGYIHTSIFTSPVYRKFRLRKSKSVIADMAVDAVLCASEYADCVEIGAEDALRTEPEFLTEFCMMVADAGADVVSIRDTEGFAQPQELFRLVRRLYREVRAFSEGRSRLSIHCHNDLGLATANTLAGLYAGASQAEVSFPGTGRREENAPLGELVMALMARNDFFGEIYTGINPEFFAETARIVSSVTGVPPSQVRPGALRRVYNRDLKSKPDSTSRDISACVTDMNVLCGYPEPDDIRFRLHEFTGADPGSAADHGLLEKFRTLADERDDFSSTGLLKLFKQSGLIKTEIWELVSCTYSSGSSSNGKFRVKVEIKSDSGTVMKAALTGDDKMETLIKLLLSLVKLKVSVVEFSYGGAGCDSKYTGRCRLVMDYEGEEYSSESCGNDDIELFIECFLNIVNSITARFSIVVKQRPGA